MNYSNDKEDNRPIRRGKMSDVIRPKKRMFFRATVKNDVDVINDLHADLVRALAQLGIVLQNTHTIARTLAAEGWIKTRRIAKDT